MTHSNPIALEPTLRHFQGVFHRVFRRYSLFRQRRKIFDANDFALFIDRRDVPSIPEILRDPQIMPFERYRHMHWLLTQLHPVLHVETPQFWQALFTELRVKARY